MPRQARTKSKTGIYHVMLKGIDDRNIFMDDEDRSNFLEQLLKAKEKGAFSLLAYCFMDNHVHLLIEENEDIGISIKRMAVGYVIWHNQKYGRRGHLFQNRFSSEPVESESYFLTVIRYIHQNPVKAGLVNHPGGYRWSSYQQYVAAYKQNNTYNINAERAKAYFDTKKSFEEFMNASQNDKCLEYNQAKKYTDEELRRMILERFHPVLSIEGMQTEDRNRLIKDIYKSTEASIRQLGRVLKLGRGIVERGIRAGDWNERNRIEDEVNVR